jgi:hemoglobin
MDDQQVYAVIGEEGFTRLVRGFYRQVPDDPILGPMYPKDDLEGAEKRLRDFLMFRFGGPTTYLEERGHPRLRMRHAPFAVDQAARDRWMEIMNRSLDETGFPAEVTSLLRDFLGQVATFMINREPGV